MWGRLSDIFGRPQNCCSPVHSCIRLRQHLLAVIPEGAWITFSLLRFLIGVGMAGAITAQIPLLPSQR